MIQDSSPTAPTGESPGEDLPAPAEAASHLHAGADVDMPPGIVHEERLARLQQAQAAGRNVLLEASGELLRAMAEVPVQMDAAQIASWRQLLKVEMDSYTKLCEQMSVRREHMLAVRYVLCTALDEAASLAPWNTKGAGDGTGPWSEMALLPEFHQEREGGAVVFMLVGRMAHSPAEHMPVLEVIHHVLSLGFLGNYRVELEGRRQFEAIRHRLFTMVAAARAPVPRELSAQWKGADKGKFKLLRSVPVWASACVLGLVLIGQFSWAKYQLLTTTGELERRLHELRQIQAPEAVAPVAPAAQLGLVTLLASEIAAGTVKVTEEPTRSVVVFKGDGMFAVGQAQLAPAAQAMVSKVGQALQSVPGQIKVWGHTDNLPNPDPEGLNLKVSLARATAVAKVLTERGVAAERIKAEGKGAQSPLSSNDTEAGRAQNRRVEIEVLTASAAAPSQKEKQ